MWFTRLGGAAALLLVCAAAPDRLDAQADRTDSTRIAAAQASAHRVFLPAIGLAVAAVAILPLDERISHGLLAEDVQRDGRLSDLAYGFRAYAFPGTLLIAGSLYAAGRLGDRPGTATLGVRGLEAVILAEGLAHVAKGLAGRARPEASPDRSLDLELGRGLYGGDSYQSFLSAHTAAAFALAAALTAESRYCCAAASRRLGPVLYGAAALVGLSRMYQGRHWASDALGGAAVGTLTGLRVVHHHRGRPGSWPDQWLLPHAAAPGEGGIVLVWIVPLQ